MASTVGTKSKRSLSSWWSRGLHDQLVDTLPEIGEVHDHSRPQGPTAAACPAWSLPGRRYGRAAGSTCPRARAVGGRRRGEHTWLTVMVVFTSARSPSRRRDRARGRRSAFSRMGSVAGGAGRRESGQPRLTHVLYPAGRPAALVTRVRKLIGNVVTQTPANDVRLRPVDERRLYPQLIPGAQLHRLSIWRQRREPGEASAIALSHGDCQTQPEYFRRG